MTNACRTAYIPTRRHTPLIAVGLAICLQTPLAKSQGVIELQPGKRMLQRGKTQPLSFKQRAKINNDTYILDQEMLSILN